MQHFSSHLSDFSTFENIRGTGGGKALLLIEFCTLSAAPPTVTVPALASGSDPTPAGSGSSSSVDPTIAPSPPVTVTSSPPPPVTIISQLPLPTYSPSPIPPPLTIFSICASNNNFGPAESIQVYYIDSTGSIMMNQHRAGWSGYDGVHLSINPKPGSPLSSISWSYNGNDVRDLFS